MDSRKSSINPTSFNRRHSIPTGKVARATAKSLWMGWAQFWDLIGKKLLIAMSGRPCDARVKLAMRHQPSAVISTAC